MAPRPPLDLNAHRQRGVDRLRAFEAPPTAETRAYLLATFQIDLVRPLLVASLDARGLSGDVRIGPFDQIPQQAFDPESDLYQRRPRHVVLIPAIEDLLAPFLESPGSFDRAAALALVDDRAATLESAVREIADRLPESTIWVVAFGPDHAPVEAVLRVRSESRGEQVVEAMRRRLLDLESISHRVIAIDWESATRGEDRTALCDPRLWYLARMRLSPRGYLTLGEILAEHIWAYEGKCRKVAVVDLDNTLWGGIVGEAGIEGITLGNEGLGLAFQDFQRQLLHLHQVGVLLAVCSKNNEADAWEAFDRHPGMVLRREHLAGHRINWLDKATNLRDLAEELNLGTDSFVFLDDNPVEREWVRSQCPEVLVPELPGDPAYYASFARSLECFRRLDVTASDRDRSATYQAEALRRQARSTTRSLDDFLQSLQQTIEIAPVEPATLSRAAQLCQRTNQFNLTTRRHGQAELAAMLDRPNRALFTLRVRDRFGDSGITGLAILHLRGETVWIDSFLLSCRVLGRRVEDALLWHVVEHARAMGGRTLVGEYLPTAKNGQVARFLADRGFADLGNGQFQLDLAASTFEPPRQVDVRIARHAA